VTSLLLADVAQGGRWHRVDVCGRAWAHHGTPPTLVLSAQWCPSWCTWARLALDPTHQKSHSWTIHPAALLVFPQSQLQGPV